MGVPAQRFIFGLFIANQISTLTFCTPTANYFETLRKRFVHSLIPIPMGAGASASIGQEATVTQVGHLVSKLGNGRHIADGTTDFKTIEDFQDIAKLLVEAKVDGKFLNDIDVTEREDMMMQCQNFGVTNPEHVVTLCDSLLMTQQAKRRTRHIKEQDDDDLPSFRHVGITLLFIQRLRRYTADRGWTTAQFFEQFIKPQTALMQCSFDVFMRENHQIIPHPVFELTYDECFSPFAPSLYVSHAWKCPFNEFVNAIETYTLETFTEDGESSWSFYVDVFVCNPHVNTGPLPGTTA